MNANGRAIGTNDSLAQTMSTEQQQYAEVIEFKKEYQSGTRNVFIYAPERVNTRQLLAGAQNLAGAFYATAPDQYSFTTLTGSKTRKLGEDPRSITLDVNYTVLPNYAAFSDTSIGDFSCNLYFTILNIYSDDYLASGTFPLFGFTVEPLIVINAGLFNWFKSTATYNFVNFNTNLNLKDTIGARPSIALGGVSYPDFSIDPTKLTADQYQRFIVNGNRPLAVSLAFDVTGVNFNNAAFLARNFYGQVSYAFNYYALLANF